MRLHSRNKYLDLSSPKVMGILNLTPDSFSDGGYYQNLDTALYHVREMVNAGAAIIDIGGESTRPNATPVGLDEELNRVIPLIECIAKEFDVFLSIDTYKPAVMLEASLAGIDMVNDIWALQQPEALRVVSELNLPVCLMHMKGNPLTMQLQPYYTEHPLLELTHFFEERIKVCLQSGIKRENLILDPGFGFGKAMSHNYQILSKLDELDHFGLPLLVGLSRKSMLGSRGMDDDGIQKKLIESVAGATIAALQGVKIVRVHDVLATVKAMKIVELVLNARS